jgi:hypothetical protein
MAGTVDNIPVNNIIAWFSERIKKKTVEEAVEYRVNIAVLVV